MLTLPSSKLSAGAPDSLHLSYLPDGAELAEDLVHFLR